MKAKENKSKLNNTESEALDSQSAEDSNKSQKIDVNVELNECKEQFEELQTRYKRVLADYDNAERRNKEEVARMVFFANESLLKQFLGILDDLEKSIEHINDNGIQKIIDKFKKLLEDQGVEEIDCLGKPFDPKTQEAIESVEGPIDEVVKVHFKGYMIREKVLRPALVSVGKG